MEILDVQGQIVNAERENYLKLTRNKALQQVAEIERLEELVKTDLELNALQRQIAEEATKQYGLGVMSSTDYLSALNDQKESELSLRLHKIELAHAQVVLLTITGNMQ